METQTVDYKNLSISQLARLIRKDWKKVNYAAEPYLSAMADLETINDYYGADDGKEIVTYFLCNAASYRGEHAKAIRAELKRRVGIK